MKRKTIDSFMHSRQNNYDVMRLVAAILVILSHAYPLSLGHSNTEPLIVLSNGQMGFGKLAVIVFFVISGFLITQSFERSDTLSQYLKARILRIFPGLWVLIFFTVFIFSPFFTNLSLTAYYSHPLTYEYLKTIFLYPLHFAIPGVFETNTFPYSVNGSLWTLYIEFTFYIVVAVLGCLKLLNKHVTLLAIGLSVVLMKMNFPFLVEYLKLFPYFGMGMVFYLYKDKIVLNKYLACLSLSVLAFTLITGHFDLALMVFGSYLIFYSAYRVRITNVNFTKYGDFSYGIYIYAFPIQQAVSYITDNSINPLTNFLISLPITIFFAFLSWHLIEKPALKLKKVNLKHWQQISPSH